MGAPQGGARAGTPSDRGSIRIHHCTQQESEDAREDRGIRGRREIHHNGSRKISSNARDVTDARLKISVTNCLGGGKGVMALFPPSAEVPPRGSLAEGRHGSIK